MRLRRLTTVGALLLAAAPALAGAPEARRVVEALVARLAAARVEDLAIRQTLTIYRPDGRFPQSSGEQVLYVKLPRRQRLEQTIDGRREVRLTVDDRVWVRDAEGRVREATGEAAAGPGPLLAPLAREADALLAEWRALGIRDTVTHEARVRGRPVVVIGAAPEEREQPAVWLDPEYGVVRLVTRGRLPHGAGLLDVALSEHRLLVPGLYLPYRQEVFADGRLLFLVTVRAAAANVGLPDALFDPEALRRER